MDNMNLLSKFHLVKSLPVGVTDQKTSKKINNNKDLDLWLVGTNPTTFLLFVGWFVRYLLADAWAYRVQVFFCFLFFLFLLHFFVVGFLFSMWCDLSSSERKILCVRCSVQSEES